MPTDSRTLLPLKWGATAPTFAGKRGCACLTRRAQRKSQSGTLGAASWKGISFSPCEPDDSESPELPMMSPAALRPPHEGPHGGAPVPVEPSLQAIPAKCHTGE